MFRQSYDDEKCKCRACVFFERVIRTFHPRSIFSWTRSNLFIAYYISRNSCHYGGPAEKYRFSFDAITPIPSPSPSTSPDLYLLILALSKMDLRPVFPPPRPVHTEYTTHVTRNFRALDRRSDLPHGQNNTSGWFIRPPRRERVFAACAPANITSLSYFAIPFYLR